MKKIVLLLTIAALIALCGCSLNPAPTDNVPEREYSEPNTAEYAEADEYDDSIYDGFYDVVPDADVSVYHKNGSTTVNVHTNLPASQTDEWAEIIERFIAAFPDTESPVTALLFAADNTILLNAKNGMVAFCYFDDNDVAGHNEPTISLSEFEQIESGMTYAEVVHIIGSEGTQLSYVNMNVGDQYITEMRQWDGEGSYGANANVTFQGGKVVSKAQFGLQ